ncbi:unnamed protein product [Caenorhabditis brenneri]
MDGTPLLNMPEVVMDRILEMRDVRSILNLRKVCNLLRSYIDNNAPNSNCISISVTVVTKKILLNCDFSDKKDTVIAYYQDKKGCVVEYESNKKSFKNESFIDIFVNDLKTILHFQKDPLQRFSLSFKYEIHKNQVDDTSEIQQKLKEILESRKSQLPVEKFVMNAFKGEQIMSILPCLNPKFLKEIWILDPTFWGDKLNSLDISEAAELNQWKSAKNIFIRRSVEPTAIPLFGHTKTAFLTFETITMDDVEKMETTFLHSSTLKRLRFKYTRFIREQRLFDILGASFERPDSSEKNWYIRIAKSEDILHVMYIPRIQNIAFSRIELSDVPVGAVIQG